MPMLTELRARLGCQTPPATAAVLVPLVQLAAGPALLYEVRSNTVRQPGEICFPGGRIEPGENPVDAALRETWEELGLAPEQITLTGFLPLDTRAGGRRVQPIIGTLPASALAGIRPAKAEVAAYFTVPLAWLAATPARWYDYAPGTRAVGIPPILQNFLQHYDCALRTGYWEYEDHGIWGLTARITQALLNSLHDSSNEKLFS